MKDAKEGVRSGSEEAGRHKIATYEVRGAANAAIAGRCWGFTNEEAE